MTTVADKLHKWSLQELNLVSEGGLSRIPNVETFQMLTKGKNKRIWNYVINHVRSKTTVDKVRRTLYLKKKLKEQQENVYLIDNSMNYEKLKESLSKGTEKRKYLMRSLSTIEERILNLDQSIRKTKDEIFQTNQKTALLEHLKQLYDEKNSNLKKVTSHISSYQCALNAYQTSKMFDEIVIDLSYDFLIENKAVYDENLSRMKDLVIISSNIFKKQFNLDEDNVHTLKENFQKKFIDLKTCDLLLIDFVMLLKEINRFDLQQFTTINSQKLSVKEFILKKNKESQANEHFAHLKCDYIYSSLSAKKHNDKINEYSTLISKALENTREILEIPPMDFDNEMRLVLIQKQAENDALPLSNIYLEKYLENISNKTEATLKNIRLKKLHCKDINLIKQLFYKDADLTFNLLYTALSTIQKVTNCLNDLKLFASKELFKIPFPEESSVVQLKDCFSSEKKVTWDYCTKTKLIKSLFAESSTDNELQIELCHTLNIQPYQNISVLCENWTHFKQKLYAEIADNVKTCVSHTDINVSEVYLKIFKILEKMKFCIEKGMLSLNYGATCCQKNKSLIHEWWNQNAQYIPHIEYEGKTLKMWIDILSVLSDFELQSHI